MSERHPEVYAVLAARIAGWDGAKPTLRLEDARSCWGERDAFEVVYLDPMFGAHPKSAQPAKSMQVLGQLADAADDDAVAALIEQARRAATARVVVKRRASAIAVGQPDWRIRGRSVRFDVYRPR